MGEKIILLLVLNILYGNGAAVGMGFFFDGESGLVAGEVIFVHPKRLHLRFRRVCAAIAYQREQWSTFLIKR